jgi:hypothetical protein
VFPIPKVRLVLQKQPTRISLPRSYSNVDCLTGSATFPGTENASFGYQIYGVLNTTIFATPPADMAQSG